VQVQLERDGNVWTSVRERKRPRTITIELIVPS
jgi:hypothetical protein